MIPVNKILELKLGQNKTTDYFNLLFPLLFPFLLHMRI